MALDLSSVALQWAERGWLPEPALRLGIRRLLRERLDETRHQDPEGAAALTQAFLASLRAAPLALHTDKANEQHYELPPALFEAMLGPQRKYSCCWWPEGVSSLEAAEEAALAETAARAGLADGQRILELGCGWGSLSLWMAAHYPNASILAVSNSASQRAFIEAQARARGLGNLRVLTCDFNAFGEDGAHDGQFDRVVSVEMFEHLRNWPQAFAKVARWLRDDGRFFMHVFVHREAPYAFEARDASDWMSRHFFSGGMMPSDDLALLCQDDLALLERWRWDGRHYARTAAAWLERLDAHREALRPVFESVYGARQAPMWWQRWRLFLLSVEELFGYDQGQQWWVSHYLFAPRR
ncbi:class I SAM-dependent methyltransferase [Hydrogenophaga sp. YM1]|uniref:Class I SAM-dependent methyltransferase n=2 Tax=Hydrogenophaga TaxID=47420 RepID=A0A372EGC5_9BURK|nr:MULTISPECIES: cyclopropane-fatty-acyl-phospholipid synthase family protein [Hydrogenophaga]QRR33849.1 class I SAM-dependent methyltransferase [Hydrogenophaga sp. YM1]RFP77479.1 class I SAM-dependent methyltransferase [Hydrogenophaga borbori]WQB83227.1 cyclopropane-fatty-acyl-phospholipid synthase family protein [Hydrogenophaga sp. SNF1]